MKRDEIFLRDVIELGRDACRGGHPLRHNPYLKEDPVLRAAWVKGWVVEELGFRVDWR